MKASKGSKFERQICVALSEWWTGGDRDDVFWRSSTSGARATQRSKKGKDTAGQYGDVCAIDPIGADLLDVFTIEIKRGYKDQTPYEVIDKGAKHASQKWEKWVGQAVDSHLHAGSLSWMLITRRDQRSTMVFMPLAIALEFESFMESFPQLICCAKIEWETQLPDDPGITPYEESFPVFGGLFEGFLDRVTPAAIKRLTSC